MAEPWELPWPKQQAPVDPAGAPPVGPNPWDLPWPKQAAAAPPDAPFSLVNTAKQAGVGVAKGAISIPGMAGDVGALLEAGVNVAGPVVTGESSDPEKLRARYNEARAGTRKDMIDAGIDPAFVDQMMAGDPETKHIKLPTSHDIQKKVEGYTGEFRKPQNWQEGLADTAGTFLPNAAMPVRAGMTGILSPAARRTANVLAPAAASETAGQVYKGTPEEPWARAIAAGAVPFGAALSGRFITPNPTTQLRQDLANTLRQHDLYPTAGQITNNKLLKNIESQAAEMPFSGGHAATRLPQQQEDLARAAIRTTGENIPQNVPVTRDVIDGMLGRIGNRFEVLGQRNAVLLDGQLGTDMLTAYQAYHDVTAPTFRAPIIDRIVQDIYHRSAAAPGSPLSGAAYNNYTSQLAAAARGTRDPAAQRAIYAMRHALDEAMERSMAAMGSRDLGAFREVRGQYRNALIVEHAMTQKSSALGLGEMSSAALGTAARAVGGRRNYARGRGGDINDLAVAAEDILKPLPQSGTAGRSFVQNAVLPGIGAAAGHSILDIPGALVGAAAGAAVPGTIGRAVMSNTGQRYLGNQVLGGEARPSATRRALVNMLLQSNRNRADEEDERNRERKRLRITVRPRQE